MECIVAALLLATIVLALAGSARASLSLADDAALVARAQALATTRVEAILAGACNGVATGTDGLARINVLWQATPATTSLQLHLQVHVERSPVAWNRGVPITFGMEAGNVCQ